MLSTVQFALFPFKHTVDFLISIFLGIYGSTGHHHSFINRVIRRPEKNWDYPEFQAFVQNPESCRNCPKN